MTLATTLAITLILRYMTITNSTNSRIPLPVPRSTLSITLIPALRYMTIHQHTNTTTTITNSTLSAAHLRNMPLATALATAGAKVAGAGLAWL